MIIGCLNHYIGTGHPSPTVLQNKLRSIIDCRQPNKTLLCNPPSFGVAEIHLP